MTRATSLIKDILLFGLASFAPKIISFFLVPLYTSLLSTEVYGTFDLLTSIYGLLLPVVILTIPSAVMFYTVDSYSKGKDSKPYLKYGLSVVLRSAVVLFIFFTIFSFIKQSITTVEYLVFIFIRIYTTALYNCFVSYLKGIDRIFTVVLSSIINSVATILFNIFFIVYLKWKIEGLFFSSCLGDILAMWYLAIKSKALKVFIKSPKISKQEKKNMIALSVPLMFSGLAWWINNSSDRLVISLFLDVSYNGIYAVANKLPTILTSVHTIFYQALQLGVLREKNAVDKSFYYKKVYFIYTAFLIIICSVLMILNKFLAIFLFRNDFYVAWMYSPGLMISVVMFSLAGYLSAILGAEKDTLSITKSTGLGALVNTALNLILIPVFNLYGAVIATIIGYIVIWFVLLLRVQKNIKIDVGSKITVVGSLLLIIQWIFTLFVTSWVQFLVNLIICSIIIIFFRKAFVEFIEIAKNIAINKILRR